MFKSLNFSRKLLLGILSVVFLASAINTYFIMDKSYTSTEEMSKEIIKKISEVNALRVKKDLDYTVDIGYAYATVIKNMIKEKQYTKQSIIDYLKRIVKQNPDIIGVWSHIYAGTLFQRDPALAGTTAHDKTGRFTPWVLRSNGKIVVIAGSEQSDSYKAWVNGPEDAGKEYVTTPYWTDVNGEQKLVVSMCIPIFWEGKFVGSVGADISLASMQERISKIKILEKGYAFLITDESMIIGHPDKKYLGTKLSDVKTYKHRIKTIIKDIKENKDLTYYQESSESKINSYYYVKTFKIANSNTNWALITSVPKDEYLASANEIKTFSIFTGIIGFLIVALVIFYNTRILNKNLAQISLGLTSFFKYLNKESKEVQKIPLHSEDEFGTMAKEINANIEKIEANLNQDITCVNEVLNVVKKIKDGNLDVILTNKASNPELVQLSSNFNEMLQSLQHKVGKDLNVIAHVLNDFSKYNFTAKIPNAKAEIENSINNLGIEVSSLLAKSLEVGLTLDSSSSKLTENVDILNNLSNETAASLEETAAALEEITSTIISTSENMSKMSQGAQDLSHSATQGQKLASDTTVAMDDITEQVTLINEAISVIDQIAFQTNILSLNAAVEAATAGEAGKGFAVVAQEVRNLASRSAEAAKEIKELVENATLKASQGKEISGKMITGYDELLKDINSSIGRIDEISSASEEQKRGITQINDAVTRLDQQTQENASIANKTQNIAAQTDTLAKEIVDEANKKEFLNKKNI